MVDDPQSASEIMCSWCMCVDGELVEWVVDESGCLRIRWLFDGVAMLLQCFDDVSMPNECARRPPL